MCGIAGFIDRRLVGKPEALRARAQAMGEAIKHRGPDGEGVFVDEQAGLALSHRRLAIVDLSPAGAQPMVSADGRFVICYNGEVYNADELRRDAAGVPWRGHSDTEVILELVARYGFEATIPRLNGMFAIALWDRRERHLHLARDRMGIKPLFLAKSDDGIAFASELKAFRASDEFRPHIDPRSVASFLRLGYVPAPHCIYEGVAKLMPGERWRVSSIMGGMAGKIEKARFWRLDEALRQGQRHPWQDGQAAAVDALDAILRRAVARQMISDVPLGAFLSGGVDSSAVTAMMVAANRGRVRTFSIGFENAEFDESQHAAAVAAHLGTEHTELRVSNADALATVPLLPTMFDEPFADSSQLPTYLVSKLTRQHVTVALSGDGGDELFAGYNRHRLAVGQFSRLRRLPLPVRAITARAMAALAPGTIDFAASFLPDRFRARQASDKLAKLAKVLPLDDDELYLRLVSQQDDLATSASDGPYQFPGIEHEQFQSTDLLARMQYLDAATYLPDDILQKVDRTSMAVALEARPPLLDNDVVDFACSLPTHLKIRAGETKWVLRQVLYRFVPSALIDRPKMGFGVPLAEWLRGPLMDWARDMVRAENGAMRWCDREQISKMLECHLNGRRNDAYALWPILMLSAWSSTIQ